MHINAAAVLVYILANKQRYFSTSHAALNALVLALRVVHNGEPFALRRLSLPLIALLQVAQGVQTDAEMRRTQYPGVARGWIPSGTEALVIDALRRGRLALRAAEDLFRVVPRETLRRKANNVVATVKRDPAAFTATQLQLLLDPPRSLPPPPPRKATPAVLQTVEDVVKKTPCTTLAHIRSTVLLRHPGLGNVSTSTISRWVKKELCFSLKKPTFRAAATLLKPRTLARRNDFPARFHDPATAPLDKDGNVSYEKDDVRKWRLRPEFDRRFFHHLDESGFNTHTGLRKRAWAPIGKQAHVVREASRSRNHSLIVVLGLQPRAKHGVIASRWKPGGYPRAVLISFLKEEYMPAANHVHARGPSTSTWTTAARMSPRSPSTPSQTPTTVEIVLIPPYSPVLNPCELVFSKVKARLALVAQRPARRH